jgi:hypothetical protein
VPLTVQLAIGIFDMVVKHSFATAHACMQSVPPTLRHSRSRRGKVQRAEKRCRIGSVSAKGRWLQCAQGSARPVAH